MNAIFYCTLAIVMSILSLWYSANAFHMGASLRQWLHLIKKTVKKKNTELMQKDRKAKRKAKPKVVFILDSTNHGE